PSLFRRSPSSQGRGTARRGPGNWRGADDRALGEVAGGERTAFPPIPGREDQCRDPRTEALLRLWFRDWPVRWKLLALIAAASAVPLVVATLVAFRTGSTLMRRSALELLAARADHLAGDLDAFHLGFRRATDRLATMPGIKDFCTLPAAARRGGCSAFRWSWRAAKNSGNWSQRETEARVRAAIR